MEPTPELIDALFVEKVVAARERPIMEKLFDGPRLFAYACDISRLGIRMQNPDASPEDGERLLRERLAIGRRLREANDE